MDAGVRRSGDGLRLACESAQMLRDLTATSRGGSEAGADVVAVWKAVTDTALRNLQAVVIGSSVEVEQDALL